MLKKMIFATVIASGALYGKDVMEFKDLTRVEPGKETSIQFKLQDAETRQVRLYADIRFDWKNLFGYTWGLGLTANGQPVTGARLLNKPLQFRTRSGGGNVWAKVDSMQYNIMYSPDFSDKIQKDESFIYGLHEKSQEPYRFVWDLSGLTKHIGENVVTFRTVYSVPLIFQNVRIEIDEKKMPRINDPAASVRPAPTGPLKDYRMKKPIVAPVTFKASRNGGFTAFDMPLKSCFSLPNGKWLEIAPEGKASVGKLPYEKTWMTPEYKLTRWIVSENGRLKVYDTFVNLRDEVTGVMFENSLCLNDKNTSVLRGGLDVNLPEVRNNSHPTVCSLSKNGLDALVAEDDILRNQGYFKNTSDSITLGNRSLGLPPKGVYTVEWSIYHLPGGDYYDFVNTVRRDWNSNFIWNGPLEFPYMGGGEQLMRWTKNPVPKKTVDNFLKERPVNLLMTHVASDITTAPSKATREKPFLGHGTAILDFKWWGKMTNNTVQAFKKYAPHVKLYAYMHKNLCSELGNRGKYSDSIAVDENSRMRSVRDITALYVPTPNNSYGKRLAEVYRYLVNEVGANIYMDEICLSVTDWAPYKEWDNCTVEIDPVTHKVIRKLSIPNLLTKPWLEEMILFLKSRNRELLANGPPATRTLQNHHVMQFIEHGMGDSGLISAHFSTPLAWDYARGEAGYRHFRDSLNFGALALTWSGDWSVKSFPFTPQEIRSGYLIGKERIVTRLSGRFGWNDKCSAKVYVYDGCGMPIAEPKVKIMEENGHTVFDVRMPSDHVAIIIKENKE